MFKNICILCQFFGWRVDYKKTKTPCQVNLILIPIKTQLCYDISQKYIKNCVKMMKNDVFFCFIVFCLTFKKEGFKARKSSQHLLMAKSRRMQKYLYIVLFLDTLLCLQIIAVFGFRYHTKRLYHCHIELFAKKRNIQKYLCKICSF